MKKRKLIFSLLLLFIFSQIAVAQKISEKTKFIDGKEFYIHKVKRGETLFGIAKTYHVEMRQVMVWNPAISSGLKRGMNLKIPVLQGVNAELDDMTRAGEFIYHVVEKNQSLFNISEIYQVNLDLITRFNPEVKLGIKRGEVIRIPRDSTIFARGQEKLLFHKVNKNETLFYIAQKYNIDINELLKLNPEIKKEGLKQGETIQIPNTNLIENQNIKITHDEEVNPFSDSLFFVDKNVYHCDSFQYDKVIDTLHIALILPLYITQNASDSSQNNQVYKRTKRFYELYEGILLAINNLKNDINVKIYVYDTENNQSKVIQILEKPILKSMDLILGPVYTKNVKLVADFAKRNKINMVSLLSKNGEFLNDNPYAFQANPSNEMRTEKSAYYLSNFYDSSIVVLHTGTIEENDFIQMYKKKITEAFKLSNALDEIVYKEVNYKARGQQAIEDALSLGMKNEVIITSTNQADVMEMLTKLDYLANFYDITVYGMPEWERFNNVELDLFTKLNTHYPTSSYIDYSKPEVKNFIREFRNNFTAEPGIYAYQGFDIATFFVKMLEHHGRHFQNCMQEPDVQTYSTGLMSHFNFKAKNVFSGFENNGIYIIQYMPDYTLKVKAGGLQQGYFLKRYQK